MFNGIEYVDATVNNITDVSYDNSNYVSGNSLYNVYNPLGIDLVECVAISGGVPNNGDWAKSDYSSSTCSTWYGWLYIGNDYNGWVWSVTNGWQYVYGLGDGKMVAWDYDTGAWWYEDSTDYPRAYCYGTGEWYTYVSGVSPSRVYKDDNGVTVSEIELFIAIHPSTPE